MEIASSSDPGSLKQWHPAPLRLIAKTEGGTSSGHCSAVSWSILADVLSEPPFITLFLRAGGLSVCPDTTPAKWAAHTALSIMQQFMQRLSERPSLNTKRGEVQIMTILGLEAGPPGPAAQLEPDQTEYANTASESSKDNGVYRGEGNTCKHTNQIRTSWKRHCWFGNRSASIIYNNNNWQQLVRGSRHH